MKKVQISSYNELAEKVNAEKRKVSISLMEIGHICSEAKETLGNEKWKEWLVDSRVNLQVSQAKKFIAVYECYKNKSQSTGFLDNKGVEHVYLLTRIKNEENRIEAEDLIEKENLSVVQTKKLVKLLKQNNEISCKEAFEKLKSPSKKPTKEKPKMIPLEEYNALKEKYEALLQEKIELENKLKLLEANKSDETVAKVKRSSTNPIAKSKKSAEVLKKPVKTTLSEGTIDKDKRSIVTGGYELPIPEGVNIEKTLPDLIKMSAITNAKNNFGLNIKDAISDTATGIKIVR